MALIAAAIAIAATLSGCGGTTTKLEGAHVDGNIRLSVGQPWYVGLTGLTSTGGRVQLVSLRVEGPGAMEASVLLVDLTRSGAQQVGSEAALDRVRAGLVSLEGTVIEGDETRYAPALAVRPNARGVHHLTAVVAEYRVGADRHTQRIPINFTVTAD